MNLLFKLLGTTYNNLKEKYGWDIDTYSDLSDRAVEFFADAEEIGSSDVTCFVYSFLKGNNLIQSDISKDEFQLLRQVVQSGI